MITSQSKGASMSTGNRSVLVMVDSREAALVKPDSLQESIPAPQPVAHIDGFAGMDAAALTASSNSSSLA